MLRHPLTLLCVTAALVSQPANLIAQENVELKPAHIAKPIRETQFQDFLEVLDSRYTFKIRVDDAAFKRLGSADVSGRPINIPRMHGVTLEFILEAAAQQVGGTVRRDGAGLAIVPGNRKIEALLGPPTHELKTKLNRGIEIKRPVEGLSWDDAAEHFSEKGDIDIVVLEWQFPPAPKKDAIGAPPQQFFPGIQRRRVDSRFGDVRVALPAETRTLEKWLTYLVAKIDGSVNFRDNVILIMPVGKERS